MTLSYCIKKYKVTDAVITSNISSNEWEVNLRLIGDSVTLYTKRNTLLTITRLGSVADYLYVIGVRAFTVIQGK